MNIDDELRKVVMDLMTDQRDSFCFDDHLAKIKALFNQGHCCDCRFYLGEDEECGNTRGPFTFGVMWEIDKNGCHLFEPKQTDKQEGE